MIFIELVLGFGIGLSLGLLGGGGSILTVPAFVYLVGQTHQVAVTTSLAIVGANSMMGAYLSAGIFKHIAPEILLVAFAVLVLVIGVMLLFRRVRRESQPVGSGPPWTEGLQNGIQHLRWYRRVGVQRPEIGI